MRGEKDSNLFWILNSKQWTEISKILKGCPISNVNRMFFMVGHLSSELHSLR